MYYDIYIPLYAANSGILVLDDNKKLKFVAIRSDIDYNS